MDHKLNIDGQIQCLHNFHHDGEEVSFELDGQTFHFRCVHRHSHGLVLECLREVSEMEVGQRLHIPSAHHSDRGEFLVGNRNIEVTSPRAAQTAAHAGGAAHENDGLVAPMPGKILKIMVSEGERVERGASLLAMEAMKMEHTLKAPCAGKIKKVFFQVGEQVEAGVALLELEEA